MIVVQGTLTIAYEPPSAGREKGRETANMRQSNSKARAKRTAGGKALRGTQTTSAKERIMNGLAIKAFAKAIENRDDRAEGFQPFAKCINTYRVFDGSKELASQEIRQGVGFGDAEAALMLVEMAGKTVTGFALDEYLDNTDDGEDAPDERIWTIQTSGEQHAGDAESIYPEYADYRACLEFATGAPANAIAAASMSGAARHLVRVLNLLPGPREQAAAMKLAAKWYAEGRLD